MSTLFFLVPLVIILLAVPFVLGRKNRNAAKAKRSLLINFCAFGLVIAVCIAVPLGGTVFAAAADEAPVQTAAEPGEGEGDTSDSGSASAKGMGYIGAAVVTGLACIGAGIAVAAAAPAAIGAVSEDPKAFGKAIIFVVLGEGVAIYGLLISILIINSL